MVGSTTRPRHSINPAVSATTDQRRPDMKSTKLFLVVYLCGAALIGAALLGVVFTAV
jgi:hypothetical protein